MSDTVDNLCGQMADEGSVHDGFIDKYLHIQQSEIGQSSDRSTVTEHGSSVCDYIVEAAACYSAGTVENLSEEMDQTDTVAIADIAKDESYEFLSSVELKQKIIHQMEVYVQFAIIFFK